MNNRGRYQSPTNIRTKVLRSNSTSSSITNEQSIQELKSFKGSIYQGGEGTINKERSHSAGPGGRQLMRAGSDGDNSNILPRRIINISESRSTPSSRSVSPAKFIEKKYERVKYVLLLFLYCLFFSYFLLDHFQKYFKNE